MSELDLVVEAKKLATKVVSDFEKNVSSEQDLAVILLKGHLLIEYYLNYIIILNHDKNERIDKKSFFDKIEILDNDKCLPDNVIICLRKLNDIRNNLSHELEYRVSESEIDSVGFGLGRDYIFAKFEKDLTNLSEVRDLFVWVVNKVLWGVFFPVFKKIIEEKEKVNNKNPSTTQPQSPHIRPAIPKIGD